MHGLQEIIYANKQAADKAKAQSVKRKQQTAHQAIAKLAFIRSGKTK